MIQQSANAALDEVLHVSVHLDVWGFPDVLMVSGRLHWDCTSALASRRSSPILTSLPCLVLQLVVRSQPLSTCAVLRVICYQALQDAC